MCRKMQREYDDWDGDGDGNAGKPVCVGTLADRQASSSSQGRYIFEVGIPSLQRSTRVRILRLSTPPPARATFAPF